jgi:hypothetical protein
MQFQDNENTATILTDFVSKLLPYAKIEEQIQTEGRSMFLILNPKKPEKKGGGGSSNKPQDPIIPDTSLTTPVSAIPTDQVSHGT